MGYFFILAAIYDRKGSVGVDAALMTLLQSGYGRFFILLAGAPCSDTEFWHFTRRDFAEFVKNMNYWMVKQEPDAYSWDDFVNDGATDWTGVRNFQARNNLKSMEKGDKVLFYHSNVGKEVVGIATVSKTAFPDPTDEKWVAVELKPVKPLKKPVTLAQIRENLALSDIKLVRQSQLSVMPLTKDEFEEIVSMSN
jgi:predicted RNA-binding protein with PUA-like domain